MSSYITTIQFPFTTTDPFDLTTYLTRIDFPLPSTSLPPTLETLQTLMTHHTRSISWENTDGLNNIVPDITPNGIYSKLVLAQRGGWCYEMNGLFERVLREVGFDVTAVAANVLDQYGVEVSPDEEREKVWVLPPTHKILHVRVDQKVYLVDVGFGGAGQPRMPLEIVDGSEGRDEGSGDMYRLVKSFLVPDVTAKETDKWGMVSSRVDINDDKDSNIGIPGYTLHYHSPRLRQFVPAYFFPYPAQPLTHLDCLLANHYVVTSRLMSITRQPMASINIPEGRITLLGNVLRTVTKGEKSKRVLEEDERMRVLKQVFGIGLRDGGN